MGKEMGPEPRPWRSGRAMDAREKANSPPMSLTGRRICTGRSI